MKQNYISQFNVKFHIVCKRHILIGMIQKIFGETLISVFGISFVMQLYHSLTHYAAIRLALRSPKPPPCPSCGQGMQGHDNRKLHSHNILKHIEKFCIIFMHGEQGVNTTSCGEENIQDNSLCGEFYLKFQIEDTNMNTCIHTEQISV